MVARRTAHLVLPALGNLQARITLCDVGEAQAFKTIIAVGNTAKTWRASKKDIVSKVVETKSMVLIILESSAGSVTPIYKNI